MAKPISSSSPSTALPPISGRMGPPGRGPVPKVRANNAKHAILRVWSYMGQHRAGVIAALILTAIGTLLNLAGPYLLGRAVNEHIVPRITEGLLKECLLLLAVYVLGSLMMWAQSFVMIGVSQLTVKDLRQDLFSRLQQLPISFFDKNQSGDLMSRATNDIDNVSTTLNQSVTQLMSSAILLVGSLSIMLALDVRLTLLSLITVPLITIATRLIASKTRKHFTAQQKLLGELNGYAQETIAGQKVVTAYNRQNEAHKHFVGLNEKLRVSSTQAQSVSGLVGPTMNVMNNIGFAILAAVGGWMAYHNLTSIGLIVSFLAYSRQIERPINDLANQYNLIQAAIAGAERVFHIIDTPSEYVEEQKKQLDQIRGKVVFEHVSFGYTPERPILKDVSFTAQPGEMIALVGPTGAGKTTIINLLPRFYDITGGRITIDDCDIAELEKDPLRRELGIVLQDAYLFSGTIRDNIAYGKPDATIEQIRQAAELANAHSFIRKLPQGYDTSIIAGGSNLSQGQRQLLTIARAILADPAILILDEATSSIDTRTEMHIQQAMRTLMKGRTSFVIAHRLSTIREADQILVIDAGEITERGNHETLMKKQGFYYQLHQGHLS
ncbi:multidrug ABC transporter ATP-binding protein [Paenibacillus sp. Root52]|uniref:ABC transporter ATP-binding protein n=1 Tax=Paenibacillus sp. Root52 TaxID=1736552 RepID=UPI0006FAD2FB|nr:ABC transporter ATP-binding protein [Paenibacillus sp. Root52]KQY91141.1 multidrug ABC transporter ATP-binding protein [Paenibacillus sp. Root52]